MVKVFGSVRPAHNRAGQGRAATAAILAVLFSVGLGIGCIVAPGPSRQAVHECSLEESLHATRYAIETNGEGDISHAHLVNVARRLDQAIADLQFVARSSHPSNSQAARTLARIGEAARQE